MRRWSFWFDKWFCSCIAEPSVERQSQLGWQWRGMELVKDTSVCGGMVANWIGLLVLCFSDWLFSQWGKHRGFVKYSLRLRSKGKEKGEIFFNFRLPPTTLHIHPSNREQIWPENHCHVGDFRALLTTPGVGRWDKITATPYQRPRTTWSAAESPFQNFVCANCWSSFSKTHGPAKCTKVTAFWPVPYTAC